jgi:perosamine synthetase
MPPGIPGGISSYFLIPILLNDRDYVAARLKERGIETRVCYPIPLYSQPIMQQFHADPCTIAEEACAQVLDLPIFFGMTSEQQQRVIDELADAAQQQARSAA